MEGSRVDLKNVRKLARVKGRRENQNEESCSEKKTRSEEGKREVKGSVRWKPTGRIVLLAHRRPFDYDQSSEETLCGRSNGH